MLKRVQDGFFNTATAHMYGAAIEAMRLICKYALCVEVRPSVALSDGAKSIIRSVADCWSDAERIIC